MGSNRFYVLLLSGTLAVISVLADTMRSRGCCGSKGDRLPSKESWLVSHKSPAVFGGEPQLSSMKNFNLNHKQ